MRATAKEMQLMFDTIRLESHHLSENSRQTFDFLHIRFQSKQWLSHADERIVHSIARELTRLKTQSCN